MATLTLVAMLVHTVTDWPSHGGLICSGLVRAACVVVGASAAVLASLDTGQPFRVALALLPAGAHRLGRRVPLAAQPALNTAEGLLQLSRLTAKRPLNAATLSSFAQNLCQGMRADRLWLHASLPSGPIYMEISAESATHHGSPLEHLGDFKSPAHSEAPGVIRRRMLPEGWRAGLYTPLRPDGRDAGYIRLGWTHLSKVHLAVWRVGRLLREAVPNVARAPGVFWANAQTAHELQKKSSRLDSIIDHSNIAIVAIEPSGRVAVWNTAIAKLVGTPATHAVGRHVTDLFALTDDAGEAVDLTEMRCGTVRLTTRTGRSLWVKISVSTPTGPYADGLLAAVLIEQSTIRQLTHMRHLLLDSARHELRGSLAAISGHAQLLDDTSAEAEAKESINAIQDAVELMERAITDLTMAINADSSSIRPVATHEPIDISQLLHRTLQSVPSVASRSLVSEQQGIAVRGDPVRLRQCLFLLLGNVEKYAPEGKVSITIHVEREHGVITIADEGPGLSENELQQALTPYYRSARTGDLPGTGLGLHIARTMMSAMHGGIELTHATSGGLRVDIWLPLEEPHQRSNCKGAPPVDASGRR
ncbi:sensor histidine kinase [Actinomadura montaniterrae]|nr:ATP-binding protein [Actinomadura montaniterrae]